MDVVRWWACWKAFGFWDFGVDVVVAEYKGFWYCGCYVSGVCGGVLIYIWGIGCT